MRPLRLAIHGLRSYRHECVIDFMDRSLIAIVGDTGAGKSSILEAITYALYNSSTWSAGETRALIADGMQTMKVELDFQAGGHTWRVLRSTSRGGYPPPTHRLECLDDGPAAPPLIGEDAVRRQVEKLLGMNRKAFLSAVILPQGRFQALLQEEPTERTRILKGIFRLDELESVRGAADGLRRRVEPVLAELRGRRSALPADPQADANRLRQELALLGEQEEGLSSVLRLVQEAQQAARDAQPEIRALEEPAQRLGAQLAELRGRPPAARLAELAALGAHLDDEFAAATRERTALDREDEQLAARLRIAAERGEALSDLVAATQALRQVMRGLEEVGNARLRIEEGRRRADAEAAALVQEGAALLLLEQAAREATAAQADAEETVERHRRHSTDVGALLARARHSAGRVGELDLAREDAERRLGDLRQDLDTRDAGARAAAGRLAAAREALERLRRGHAAAHAAQGLGPGDPCPVCSAPLPAGFRPPDGEGLAAAEDAFASADGEARQASNDRTQAEVAARLAERTLREQQQLRSVAAVQAAAEGASLRRLLPEADLALPDAQLLRPIEAEGLELAGAMTSRRDESMAARSAYDRSAAALALRRQTLDRDLNALAGEDDRMAQRIRECEELLGGLPASLRTPSPPAAAAVAPLLDKAAEKERQARVDEDRAMTLRAALRESQSRLDVLRERRRQDVDLPVQRVVQDLGALLAGTAVAHHALGRPSASTRFEAGEPTALAAEAGRVQQIAEQALADVSGAAWDLRQAVQGKLNEADDAVRAAGFASRDELEHELELVKRTGGATETRLRDAERQIPVARDLDQRIARGTGTADTLGELHRLLSDSQFVRHVIERRQRMLLVVASETLGAMTGRRYGFSADFQVVDRLSGQPRSTKTLSGGETFLASLALSLALVEIASRAGGKLDALFLDEGFGSLDANALDEAMGALERRAGQGRLVAVVSHIKAVAERIETVLEVAKQPGGSVARWRDGTRAQELVEQELEAGLLT